MSLSQIVLVGTLVGPHFTVINLKNPIHQQTEEVAVVTD